MLIDEGGAKSGIVSLSDALQAAKGKSLDLVQVSPQGNEPVVCKILDYGKMLFHKKKSVVSSKSKTKKNTIKEIKFRPSTDLGDYNIKLKKLKALFLTKIRLKLASDLGEERFLIVI